MTRSIANMLIVFMSLTWALSCKNVHPQKIPIILDTDANNELDDQHALAYLFFNENTFDIKGITVNATLSGGSVEQHYEEAQRVMKLCAVEHKYPLLMGADSDFLTIRPDLDESNYDGRAAVEFIIEEARNVDQGKLLLVPIGKLTNIALAVFKAPDIKDKIRIIWLGSNYPNPGEYNLVNDIPAMNYLLDQGLDFDMVTVRYGESSGSDAVRISLPEVMENLEGKGPKVEPVSGRHGGKFTCFGDYSKNLFAHIDLYGDPPSRALFDVVALAIIKNPQWGERKTIPAPIMQDSSWADRSAFPAQIGIWENFAKSAIIEDFFNSLPLSKM